MSYAHNIRYATCNAFLFKVVSIADGLHNSSRAGRRVTPSPWGAVLHSRHPAIQSNLLLRSFINQTSNLKMAICRKSLDAGLAA
ncbi:hypothetical protein CIW66_18505 [Enterobacter cloacae]|nr:hypothetical protein CDN97_21365 [Pantoea sp. AMG 501]PAN81608.1 hypothetical protein CIW66_18505 [Enterobacter cloacae]